MTDLERPPRWHKPEAPVSFVSAIGMILVVAVLGYGICFWTLALILDDWFFLIPGVVATILAALLIGVPAWRGRARCSASRPRVSDYEEEPVP